MEVKKISGEHIQKYRSDILKSSSASTFDRKIFSLKKFFEWAVKEGYLDESPVEEFLKNEQNIIEQSLGKIEKQRKLNTPSYSSIQSRIIAKFAGKPKLQKLAYNLFYKRPKWYLTYHNLPIASYFNYAFLFLLMSAVGYGAYNQFFKRTSEPLAYPTALTAPSRFLSFQGRLTDKNGNPITAVTSLDFKLYNASQSGTLLWDSGACSISPDPDGIFSTLLGSSCGSEIASSVFSENAAVWLGATVGADTEATPRVQIATVAYALNSETLQGFPASMSATAYTIPAINSSGYLVLGSSSPKLQSTSGTFAIEGQALTITTPNTSNGSISINPDGTGTLNLTFEGAAPGGSAQGFVNATNANLTSQALYYGEVASDATGYNLLELASGTTPRTKFAVDSAGNATLSGTINGLAISSGSVTGGIWNGTLISTTYGGTGQDWDSVAQGSIPYFSATGTMSTLNPNTAGYILSTNGAGANPSWIPASGVGTNYWKLVSGGISPFSDTLDVLFGSSATSSAKFAFTGIGGGIPTASISGTTTNSAIFIDGNGNISTTNGSDLILGNSSSYNSTGNILLNPSGGNVGIGTTNPTSALAVNGDITATGTIRNVTVHGTVGEAVATVAKTTTISNYTLTTGDLLSITFTNGNSAAAATLNINGTGAHNIRLGNSNVTAVNMTLAAGSTVLMYYDGTYFQIMGSQRLTDTDTNTYDRTYWNNAITAGVYIYDYKLVMQASDGKWYPLTLETGTGNTKTVSTQPFIINSPILYYATTTDVAANTTFTNVYSEYPMTTLTYTANTSAWTNQQPIYLKGTIDSNGNFVLDNTTYSSFISQTLPTSDDGFVYILLGQMYSTTAMRLFQYHPMYQYKYGAVREYSSTYGLFLASAGGYATVSSSLAIGNTNAAAGTGHLNMTGDLSVGGTTTLGGLTYTWPGSRTNGFLIDNGSGVLSWTTSLPSGTTISFDKITSGTNTTAAMVVGAGASLNYTSTGTINASSLTGNTWAAPGAIGSTTPNTGTFTSLGFTYATSSGSLALGNTSAAAGPGHLNMSGNLIVGGTLNGLTVSSGTISSGTWNGTAIGTTYGGTGQDWDSVAQGSVPYFSGTGTMSTLAPGTSGWVLTTQGTGANPTWTDAGSVGTNYWQLNNLLLAPANQVAYDLLVGGTTLATGSANFQVYAATGNVVTAGDLTVNGGDILTTGTTDLTLNPAGDDVFLGTNDNLNLTSATDLIFGGTTSLGETNAANDSGAYLVGVYDNLGNSASTNVQGVLSDFDTSITNLSGKAYWQLTDNSLAPSNTTYALNVGSTASTSAYFHVPGTNNADAWFNLGTGNVGIGTTNPQASLQIDAQNGVTGLQINGGSTANTDLLKLVGNASTQRLILERVGGATTFLEAGGSIGLFGTSSNHDFRIRTNYLDRMSITTSGDVGINDTSPDARLEVLSTTEQLRLTHTDDTYDARFTVDGSGDLTINVTGSKVSISDNLAVAGYATTSASLNVGGGNASPGIGNISYSNALLPGGVAGTSGYVLTSSGGGVNTWTDPATISGVNFWQLGSNILAPVNISNDLAIGGNATSSAKFQVFGKTGDIKSAGYATISGSLALGNTTAKAGPGHLNMSGDLTLGGLIDANGTGTHDIAGTLNLSGNTLSSSGDLTIDAAGGGVKIGTGSPGTVDLAGDDLYVTADLEVDGSATIGTLTGMIKGTSGTLSGITGTSNYLTYWSDTNTIAAEQYATTAQGGMGNNVTAAGAGEILYSTGTTTYDSLIAGTSGQALISGGAGAPSWGTLGTTYGGTGANNSTAAQYSIPYYSTSGVLGGILTPGTDGYVLTTHSTGGVPTWTSAGSLGVNHWQLASNVLTPINTTNDLAIGGNATSSAKFQVFGKTGDIKSAGYATVSGSLALGNTTAVAGPGHLNMSGNLTLGGLIDANGTGTHDIAGTLNLSGNTLTSTGDLSIDAGGGDVNLGSGDNLNLTSSTDLFFGTTSLGETTSNTDSGAYIVGVNDEFTYATATNVQGVLKEFDTKLGTLTSSDHWQLNNHVLSPANHIDYDLAIGGTATSTAKFQTFAATGNIYSAGSASVSGNLTLGNVSALQSAYGPLTLNYKSGANTYTAGLSLTNSGYVGIGKTDPGYLLDVNGNARTTGTLYVDALVDKDYSGNSITFPSVLNVKIGGGYGLNVSSETVGTRLNLSGGDTGPTSAVTKIDMTGNTVSTSHPNYAYQWIGINHALTLNLQGTLGSNNQDVSIFKSVITTTNDLVGGKRLFLEFSKDSANKFLVDFSGNLYAAGYATASASLALGNTTARTGPGNLNASGRITGVEIYQGANQVCDTSGNCGSVVNYWQLNNHVLSPANYADYDLAVGGTATSSAKFQVLASNGNLTTAGTASVSGNLTLGNGSAIQSAYGPVTLNYKSGADAYTAGLSLTNSGYVGIGTTNPSQKLQVKGNVLIGDSAAGNANITGDDNPTINLNWITDERVGITSNANAKWTGGGTLLGAIRFGSGSSYALIGNTGATTNLLLNPYAGNVGIGTISPTALLDVAGAASASGSLSFRIGAATVGATGMSDLTLGSSTTGNVVINSRGSTALTANGADLTAGGNANLTASTNLIFGGTTSLGETTSPTDSGAYMVGANDEFTYATSTNVQGVLKEFDTKLGTLSSSNYWSVLSNNTIYPTTTVEDLLLGSSATSSAKFAFTGVGSGVPNILINNASVLNATTLGTSVVTSSLTTVGALANGSIANGFGTIATANTITGTTINGTTGINTGATAGTQRIDASGNLVNIGNISASGNATISGILTLGQAFKPGGSAGTAGQVLTSAGGYNAPTWTDLPAAGTNYWQYNSNVLAPGNTTFDVAIGGNATSSSKFQVMGTTGNIYTANNTVDWTLNNAADALNFDANTLSIDALNNRVGIGTTNPGAKLEAMVAQDNYIFDLTNGTETEFKLRTYNDGTTVTNANAFTQGLYYTNQENAAIHYYRGGTSLGGWLTFTTNNGSERMRIDASGNVGIGTTNPTQKLDVNGNFNLTGYATMSASLALGNTTAVAGPGNLRMSGDATISGVLSLGQAFKPGNDAGTSGYLLTSAGGGVNTWTNPATLGTNYWSVLSNNTIYPTNTLEDLLLGSSATASAKFAFTGVGSGTPNILINNVSVLNPTTLGTGVVTSSLTTVGALASGSIANGFGTIATSNTITGTTINGTTGINTGATAGTQRIDANGNLVNILNISATGNATISGILTLGQAFKPGGQPGTAGQVLTSAGGYNAPTWTDSTSVGTNHWQLASGVLAPINTTNDIATGGTATASAKFMVMGKTGNIYTANNTVDWTLNNAADALNFDSDTLSIDASNNRVGVGAADPAVKFEVRNGATNQLRLAYDSSNYTNLYTSSAGILTVNPSGEGVEIGKTYTTNGGYETLNVTSSFTTTTNTNYSAGVEASATIGTNVTAHSLFKAGRVGLNNTSMSYLSAFRTLSGASDNAWVYCGGGTCSVTSLWGALFNQSTGVASGATFNVENETGIAFSEINDYSYGGTMNITNRKGIYFGGINNANTAVTNNYVIDIAAQTGQSTTNNYGIRIGNITNGTNNYAIYTGTGKVRFGDDISTTGYATVSASLALGNTTAAKGPGHLNMSGDLRVGGNVYLGNNQIMNSGDVNLIALSSNPQLTSSALYGSWGVLNEDAGNPGLASLIVNQKKAGDLFTASSSGTPKFTINPLGSATMSGSLTLGNGTTNTIQPAYGQLTLNYKSGANTWAAGLTVDDITGHVGIGTSDPSSLLHVKKSGNSTGMTVFESNNHISQQIKSTYAVDNTAWAFTEYYSSYDVGNGVWKIGKPNGTTNFAIGVGTSGQYYNAESILSLTKTGYVGIGKTSPLTTLDVNGAASISGTLTLGNGTTNAIQPAYGPLALNYKSGANAYTAGLTLTNSGYVGIGTAVPAEKLEIAGNLTLSSNTGSSRTISVQSSTGAAAAGTDLYIVAGAAAGSATGGTLYLDPGDGTTIPNMVLIGTQTAATYVGIGTITPTTTLNVAGSAHISNNGSLYVGSSINTDIADEIVVSQTEAGPTIGLGRVDNTYFNGNALGQISFQGYATASGAQSRTTVASIRGTADGTWSADSAPARLDFYVTPSGSTSNGVQMTLDSTGYLGIGTTTPDVALDVTGASVFRGNISNDGTGISALGDQSSIVPNAGFEVDNDAADSLGPDGWDGVLSAGIAFTHSGTVAQGSKAAYMLCNTDTGVCTNARIYSSCFPVTKSGQYVFRFMARDNTSAIAMSADLLTYTSAANCRVAGEGTSPTAVNVVSGIDTTAGYALYGSGTVANGSGATWAKVKLYATLNNGEGVYFDAVRVFASALDSSVDLAENYLVDSPIKPGYIVSSAVDSATATVEKASSERTSPIGIVSTNPAITLGDGGDNVAPVALTGRVPAIVSSQNGEIWVGDHVGMSLVAGIGAKQVKPGYSVGTALEGTSSWNDTSCPAVASIEDIAWPSDDGTNSAHPCFTLPNGTIIGKIMVAINVGTYDPDIFLTSTGDLNIAHVASGSYQLTDSSKNNSMIDRIGAFAEVAVATVKSGLINTIDIVASGTVQATNFIAENINTGAATIGDLTTNTFTAFQGTVDNLLVSSGLVARNIQTAMISPIPGEDLTVNLPQDSEFNIQDSNQNEVASIDSTGNASFSGEVATDQLAVTNEATIGGTLYADNIKSKSLDDIETLLAQVQTDQDLLKQAADWSVLTATNSANLDQLALADLFVTNQAAINSLSVTNYLSLGNDFVIQTDLGVNGEMLATSINTLSSPLKIQSLAMAPVEIMAGLIKIDTSGNVEIAGNLAVAGRVSSSGLTLQNQTLQDSLSTPSALLTLQGANGTDVATVDASGSAKFNNVLTQGLTIAGASSEATTSAIVDGVITSNATAGSAIIPAGSSEITIKNNNVTDYTLVYVTPTSTTNNYVLYVKSKGQGQFVVGFTNPLDIDVNFNWWIVKVSN